MKKTKNGVELEATEAQKKYRVYFTDDPEKNKWVDKTKEISSGGNNFITKLEWENFLIKSHEETFENVFQSKSDAEYYISNHLREDLDDYRSNMLYVLHNYIEILEELEVFNEGKGVFCIDGDIAFIKLFEKNYREHCSSYWRIEEV
jgi:hypothetical protein